MPDPQQQETETRGLAAWKSLALRLARSVPHDHSESTASTNWSRDGTVTRSGNPEGNCPRCRLDREIASVAAASLPTGESVPWSDERIAFLADHLKNNLDAAGFVPAGYDPKDTLVVSLNNWQRYVGSLPTGDGERGLAYVRELPGGETGREQQLVEFDAWLSMRGEFREVLTAFRRAFGTDTSAAAGESAEPGEAAGEMAYAHRAQWRVVDVNGDAVTGWSVPTKSEGLECLERARRIQPAHRQPQRLQVRSIVATPWRDVHEAPPTPGEGARS